jgi:hypothetical protein
LSTLELAKTRPVAPPIKNILIKPITQSKITSINIKELPLREINQVKTFIPVGTPITIVAAVK